MRGKTIVITGATSGIGEVAAIRLAQQGARIIFTARDADRAAATMTKLRAANRRVEHAVHMGDLSLLDEMKRVGRKIAAHGPIDVLVNNAGAMFGSRQVTADGLEMTFALNHMSYFVLTDILLPHIKPGGRIISVASGAHRGARLDFDDLQSEKNYSSFAVYSRSKLMNILFTRELAKRLSNRITANCLHPGFVATRFGDDTGGVTGAAFKVAKLGAISPEEGAKTIIHLASSPDVDDVSGKYFYKCRIEAPTREAQSDADAKRLWDISEKIAG